jgi:hemerythrin-like domain-containing protein
MMNPLTCAIIRDEHRALAAMLRSIPLLLAEHRRQRSRPDFEALRSMLFYVDEFPERLHHPKESELLFPKLRARAPQLRETLDELDLDHARGERAIRELQHSLLAYEMMGEPRRARFEQQLGLYIDGYLRHMAREEADVLPAALRTFKPEDWTDLDEAFASNRDPLAGHPADGCYQQLFSRILNTVPAPVGLGAPR